MSFAKHTTIPPAFDANNAVKGLPAPWTKFPEWKRWVEATGSQDAKGVKDVVEANAQGLDVIKVDVDEHAQRLADAEARIAALEARPVGAFPFA